MKVYSVFDPEFAPYGKVITGIDNESIMKALNESTPLPEGVGYVPSAPALECLPVFAQMRDNVYGGMPIQLGWCNGHNTKLNCLEYHRDSEVNLGTEDFILLLAKQEQIVDGVLDTADVKAFACPKGVMIEVYATSLHYAPCSAKPGMGFRVLVALPKGTNEAAPEIKALNAEDKTLWACNKWLLAHAESAEAAQGAYVGLKGVNIDLAE